MRANAECCDPDRRSSRQAVAREAFWENDGRNQKPGSRRNEAKPSHLFRSKFRDQRRLAGSSSDIFRIYAWDKYNRSSLEENLEIHTSIPTSIQGGRYRRRYAGRSRLPRPRG